MIENLRDFIVENEKSARQFIKDAKINLIQNELNIVSINKHKPEEGIEEMLVPCMNGKDVGIISEAGMPCIADPGFLIVKAAQAKGIKVIPLNGLNSMLMALMASGFSGQQFAFHGYLPFDKSARQKKLKEMESTCQRGVPQIFMETPYRNEALFAEMLQILRPSTQLCIAANISHPEEYIVTRNIENWKKEGVDLKKIPAVFILGS